MPHHRATIDGTDLHFLYFKGQGNGAQPLLLTNGWPLSFVEFTRLVPMLLEGALAFEVEIPAHPGYGFSPGPTAPGQAGSVVLFHRLMTEGLGYTNYIVSGTDIGAGVGTRMALACPDAVRGLHIAAVVDPPFDAAAAALTDAERAYHVVVPTAVCMWPQDVVTAPVEWARRFYNVQRYTVQPHGGHFPAWEQPALYAADLCAFAASLV